MSNTIQTHKFDCGCEFPILQENPLLLDFRVKKIPGNCPKVWELLATGRTKGVFQLESQLGRRYCKILKPESIEHLAALGSILRPGVLQNRDENGVSLTDHYCKRKNNLEETPVYHESLKDILTTTYQIIVYQEQAILIAQQLAGFNPVEADLLRIACIAKGSLILTQNGPRYIEEICENINNKRYNTKILSVKGNKLQYSQIKNVWSNGQKETWRIRTTNGYNIDLTNDHQIFTQDGWKRVSQLTIEDFVILPTDYIYKGYGDFSEDEAILLAYFISEGCYTQTCSDSPKITNSDRWILEKIKTILMKLFGENSYRTYQHKNGCQDIYFKNNALAWIQEKYHLAKSKHKTIPSYITNCTDGITKAFIGSYFSAEGCVNKSNLEISSTSLDICKKIQILLLRDGIYSSLQTKNTTYKNEPYISYRILISDAKYIHKFKTRYKDYICPTKLNLLENFKQTERQNSRCLVPKCFIKAVTDTENLNSIFGLVNGRMYSENMTYDIVSRMNQSLNSELLNNILEAEYRFVKIEKIENVGLQEVYDFQTEDDSHCGFINGILVHNCGKKLPEEMAKVEKMFAEGAIKTGLVNEEQAKEIFSWIKKSQRYSFNKSHATAYGITGYDTAYLKAHFPQAFFLSWLMYAKDKEEMDELIEDAHFFNIDVRPPDLRDKQTNFYIKDNKIRFGLSNIKGMGEANIEKILQKELNGATWYEFLLQTLIHLPNSVVVALIKSGSVDYFGLSRNRMSAESKALFDLTDNELIWVKDNWAKYTNLVDLFKAAGKISKEGGATHGVKRANIIQSHAMLLENPPSPLTDSPEWIIKIEKDLLGASLTCNTLDTCNTIQADTTCREFANGLQEKVKIAGEIKRINVLKSKRGRSAGEDMAFLSIADSTGMIGDVMMFPDAYKKYSNLIIEGNTILVTGERDKKTRMSLVVKKLQQL